jgi:SPP1 gp7 family putative phage head morphogenesis protein
MNRATRRLTTLLRLRNDAKHRRGAAVANATDKVMRVVWDDFLFLLRHNGSRWAWTSAGNQALRLFGTVYLLARSEIASRLGAVASWSWRGAVCDIGAAVPKRLLARASGLTFLPEDESESRPDSLALQDYLDFLFPSPPEDEVKRILYGNDWQERLAACTRLADPATLASIVANGLINGKSQQEIAQQIAPAVNNVRASARRIARTESVRVAGAMQMKAHEALGDLVIGYQVHSMHDIHTRPWHLKRDGTIYYKEPGPGQKGLFQMPHPPDEPQDPAERPPGKPQTAWN